MQTNGTTGKEIVISINGLCKSFGNNHVLRGVDLEVGRGENVVVLGRSGSGKSVLIKIICGLLSQDEGSVIVLGEDVKNLHHRRLEQLRLKGRSSAEHRGNACGPRPGHDRGLACRTAAANACRERRGARA